MDKISTFDFKQFKGETFKVEKVYPRYRVSKFVKGEKTLEYVEFPVTDDEVLENGTPRLDEVKKEQLGEKTMYREKAYEEGKYVYKKVKNDKDFFANTTKVFDIDISFAEPKEVEYYKGEKLVGDTDLVQIKRLSSGKVKDMMTRVCKEELKTLVLIPGKDKLGKTVDAKGELIMVKPYDYEDTYKDTLVGKYIEMDFDGVGIDTKYLFAKGEAFKAIVMKKDNAFAENDAFGPDVIDMPF